MQPILLVLFLTLVLAVVIWALYRYPQHRLQWQRSQQREAQQHPMRRSSDRYLQQ